LSRCIALQALSVIPAIGRFSSRGVGGQDVMVEIFGSGDELVISGRPSVISDLPSEA